MDVHLESSNILILGSSGLIGSAFSRKAREHRYSNVLTPSRGELDLENETAVNLFFEQVKPEIVILAAGKVGGIVANRNFPFDFLKENLRIQMSVANASVQNKVRRTVIFGSSCMYPKDCVQPMPVEKLWTGELEVSSLSYAVSKLAGIQLGLSFNQQNSCQRFLCVIPNSVYGPNDNFNPESGHVLSSLIARFHHAKSIGLGEVELWGTGNPRREFLFSDDLASAVFMMLKNDINTTYAPVNIGCGFDVSIRELAEMVAGVVGYEGEILWNSDFPDGAHRKLLDSSYLHQLGWATKTGLVEGIKKTYEWYKNDR